MAIVKKEGSRGGHIVGHTKSGNPIYGDKVAKAAQVGGAAAVATGLGGKTYHATKRFMHLGYAKGAIVHANKLEGKLRTKFVAAANWNIKMSDRSAKLASKFGTAAKIGAGVLAAATAYRLIKKKKDGGK